MFRLFFNFPLYFSPDDVSGIASRNQGVESDLKFLKGEENVEKDNDEEAEDTEDTNDSDTDKEISDSDGNDTDTEEDTDKEFDDDDQDSEEDKDTEESDNTEEQDEVKLTVKDIKKDFPEFFKKHPEMRGVIYRERQYSEVFTSPQEAQSAARLADTYLQMESDLIGGNSEPLLKSLKKANDGKTFDDFVSNLLPNLLKVDSETYYKVVAVPLKKALRAALREGEKKGNKNLTASAQWIHDFLFQSADVNEKAEFEDKVKNTEKSPEQAEYEKKIQALDQRDYRNYKTSVDEEWINGVEKFFMDGLDPDNVLSDWTKKKMLEEAISQLNEQMVKDTRYIRSINSLWVQARNSGYERSFKTRIVNTSLARAKQIIPTIRQKLRSDALSERRRQNKDKDNGNKRVIKNDNSKVKTISNKKDKYKGMSDLDIIRS